MNGGPQRFARPTAGTFNVVTILVVAGVVHVVSGFDGSLLAGPGGVAVLVVSFLSALQWLFFRGPVWIDMSKRELRWTMSLGLGTVGTWRFDEVTAVRLSESPFRRSGRETVLLRVGWIRLSFEVPYEDPEGVVKTLLALGPSDRAGSHDTPAV